jgi:hypothetical protein
MQNKKYLMKSKILLFFYCIICVVLLPNCNKEKCNQHEIANLTFTNLDRSITPYTGNETLIFKNIFGDSIVLEKGSKTISSNVEYEYTRHEALAHNDCQGDFITSEKDDITFHASIGKGYLNIELWNSFSFDYPTSIKYINIATRPTDTVEVDFAARYRFINDTLFNYPMDPDSIVVYHDQITIGPKTFSDVYELYTFYYSPPDSIEWYNTAFYSIKEGLVGLRTNYGKLLYLDSKR